MAVNKTLTSYLRNLKNSVLSLRDAANDELSWKGSEGDTVGEVVVVSPTKHIRLSSAGSVTSSQDEGIHSTGEKAEDDINEEDLAKDDSDNEQTEGQKNNEEENEIIQQEEDDEGRGSLSGDRENGSEIEDVDKEQSEEKNENEVMGYVGDSEDTPSISVLDEPGEIEDPNEEDTQTTENDEGADENLKETENEEIVVGTDEAEEETEISQLDDNEVVKEDAENTDGTENINVIQEVPTIAKLPGTKPRKKKKEYVDMAKVNANRKPLSIRTTPLPVPVSSKRENKNLKPHLKFAPNKKFKLKSTSHGKTANGVPSITLESNGIIDSDGNPQPLDASNRPSDPDNKDGEGGFLNPLMDHSLKRPKAPHKLKANNTIRSSNMKSKVGVKSSNSEVFIPEENKLYVYSYSSVPRILHVKKFGKSVTTADANDTDPKSTSKIKFRNGRVIRGSNFGKDLFETEEMRQRREEFRKKLQERAKGRRNYHGISSVYRTNSQPITTSVRRTTKKKHLSPKKSLKSKTLAEGEGSHKIPAFRRSMPSISVATQVNEKELLQAGGASEAVIKALVERTIREATQEVAAETEADLTKMKSIAEERLTSLGGAEVQNDVADEGDLEETPPDDEEMPQDEEEGAPNEEEVEPDEAEAAPDEAGEALDEQEAAPDGDEAEGSGEQMAIGKDDASEDESIF